MTLLLPERVTTLRFICEGRIIPSAYGKESALPEEKISLKSIASNLRITANELRRAAADVQDPFILNHREKLDFIGESLL
ncbi:MAG: hypothetical protein LBT90_00475 [Holosporaceae bacterium]|jgi:hypothetical protein|nr:hypothetical protein [Holosporaceae bacterium]